jgi:hypothetical protein
MRFAPRSPKEPPITVTLGKTSLFENDDADVLKVDVDSADLRRVRKAIGAIVDAPRDTHPEYQLAEHFAKDPGSRST